MIEFDNLTYLHGKPQGTGLLKANPEDFVVVEDLGFEPDGEGEHILVRILKNGCNTRFVADALAKFLKIHAREVSFAGQKDKHAVTEQWLCARVPGKEMPDLSAFQLEGCQVLEYARHKRKLRLGALKGNAFTGPVAHLLQFAGSGDHVIESAPASRHELRAGQRTLFRPF